MRLSWSCLPFIGLDNLPVEAKSGHSRKIQALPVIQNVLVPSKRRPRQSNLVKREQQSCTRNLQQPLTTRCVIKWKFRTNYFGLGRISSAFSQIWSNNSIIHLFNYCLKKTLICLAKLYFIFLLNTKLANSIVNFCKNSRTKFAIISFRINK